MTADKLRQEFLSFFRKKKHKVIPSDSLVPRHDPTLLFTGAGMNQFKEQFMGKNVSSARAATSQKCLRTADLEKVGRTAGHHTFFEMLGNFSFGDYFKKEAIEWAWEFLIKVVKLPKEKLWASVYTEDTEAYDIWKTDIALAREKIIKLGDKENFWPSEAKKNGPNGPCGPCSEIFYDRGQSTGCGKNDCSPACDCGRFVEIWNLVFTQFNRKEGGVLEELPQKNIDTGMGLERLAAVKQGVSTNFKIDSFAPVIKHAASELGLKYGTDTKNDSHINAIADHIRAVVFCVADGVRPSNEGRGFVIRKLIRKALQRARSAGMDKPFLHKLVATVAKAMKEAYPELAKQKDDITRVVLNEEESLGMVIETVLPAMEEEFEGLKKSGKNNIPGALLFKYYDEKGIPLDLMEEAARRQGLTLDENGFNKLLEGQRERSRKKSKVSDSIFVEKHVSGLKTEFVENKNSIEAKILALAKEGDAVHVALDRTVFYGESGGQIGDTGTIEGKGFKIAVKDAKKYDDTVDHVGKVISGQPKEGDAAKVEIDLVRRSSIAANHTATHLLHTALKKVLGKHVNQYGSLVAPEKLRFDFTHPAKMSDAEIEKVEKSVNTYIKQNIRVEAKKMGLDQAKKSGAVALFGEKYSDTVTVRSIGAISKELCGGTHIARTGQIGVFKIISESSIASGVRRIEALTGEAAYEWMKCDIEKSVTFYRDSLKKIRGQLDEESEVTIKRIEEYLEEKLIKIDSLAGKPVDKMEKKDLDLWLATLKPELIRTAGDLDKEARDAQKRKKKTKELGFKSQLDEIIKSGRTAGKVLVISKEIKGAGVDDLRSLVDMIKQKSQNAVVFLAASTEGRVNMILGVAKGLVSGGLDAKIMIKEIAGLVGGSGGGRPDLAQAGGKDASKLPGAINAVYDIVKREVSK